LQPQGPAPSHRASARARECTGPLRILGEPVEPDTHDDTLHPFRRVSRKRGAAIQGKLPAQRHGVAPSAVGARDDESPGHDAKRECVAALAEALSSMLNLDRVDLGEDERPVSKPVVTGEF
jgi:hypothetical protein